MFLRFSYAYALFGRSTFFGNWFLVLARIVACHFLNTECLRDKVPVEARLAFVGSFGFGRVFAHERVCAVDHHGSVTFWHVRWFFRTTVRGLATLTSRLKRSASQILDFLYLARKTFAGDVFDFNDVISPLKTLSASLVIR